MSMIVRGWGCGTAALLLAVGLPARAGGPEGEAPGTVSAGGAVVCEAPMPFWRRLFCKPALVPACPPGATFGPATAPPEPAAGPAAPTTAPAPGPPLEGQPFTPPVNLGAGTTEGAPSTLLADTTGAASSGLGGILSGTSSAVVMQGDLSPLGRIIGQQISGNAFLPPAPPERPGFPNGPTAPGGPAIPTGPDRRSSFAPRVAPIVPSVRTFKFADNQTPFPVDRLFFTFNFFDYVNQPLNQRFGVPLNRVQAYRYNLGFEKTFLDKNASIGVRLPIDTLSAQSRTPGQGGTSTSLGDLSVYLKYALWQDRAAGRVLSTGLAVTAPTGPGRFAGASYLRAVSHYTFLQPFLAFQWQWDRLYLMNYLAVDVPTGTQDVTILYNDTAVGYFVYRSEEPEALLRAIAPTLESHVNIPLNHRDWANPASVAGTPDVLDLTGGVSFFLGRRSVFSLGAMTPVTGPRPVSLEAIAMLNVFF